MITVPSTQYAVSIRWLHVHVMFRVSGTEQGGQELGGEMLFWGSSSPASRRALFQVGQPDSHSRSSEPRGQTAEFET